MSWHQLAACTGKQAFATFSDAQKAARRHGRRDRGRPIEVYRCQYCRSFHIGGRMR